MYRSLLKLTPLFFVLVFCKLQGQSTAATQNICIGSTKIYTVDQADGPSGTSGSLYTWRVIETGFMGHIINQGTNSVNVQWGTTPPGVYHLGVIETNSFCPGPEIIVKVTIFDLPIVTLDDVVICSGSNANITAAVNPPDSGNDYIYNWTVPSGVMNPGDTSSFTANVAGEYSVAVKDLYGCVSTVAKGMLVLNPLPPAVITPAGPTVFCEGYSVLLKANEGTNLSYQWRKSGTMIDGAVNSSLTAVQSADYTVTVTDSKGCSQTSLPVSVTVNPLPVAVITPQTGGSLEFCEGGSVVLNANTGAGLSYQWINSNNAVVGSSVSYTAVQSSDYTLRVTNANDCYNISAPVRVTVRPLPDPSITPSGVLVFCSGDNVVLNALMKPGLSYQWKNTTGIITGAVGSSYTAAESSDYSVTVTDENHPEHCSATTPSPIKVVKISMPVTGTISHD